MTEKYSFVDLSGATMLHGKVNKNVLLFPSLVYYYRYKVSVFLALQVFTLIHTCHMLVKTLHV